MSNAFVELAKLRELCRSLQRKATKLGRMKTKLNLAKEKAEKETNDKQYMEKIMDRRWRAQASRADGVGPWKNKEKPNGKPNLVNTGALKKEARAAVAGTFMIGRGRTVFDIGEIGLEYAEYLQNGTEKMVARPFFLNPTQRELREANLFAYKALKKYLKEAFK